MSLPERSTSSLSLLATALRSRLCRKIVLAVFTSIIVIEIIILIPSYVRREDELLRQLEDKVSAAILTLYSHDLSHSREDEIKRIKRIVQMFNVKGVYIQSLDAAPINMGDSSALTEMKIPAAGLLREKLVDTPYYVLGWHIKNAGILQDQVLLKLDISDIENELSNFVYRIAGLTLIISLFVTLATILALWPFVLRPLLQLQSYMVRQKDHGKIQCSDVTITMRNDEIGDIFRSFFDMLEQETHAKAELQAARQSLEKQVQERTMDLERLNAELKKQYADLEIAENRFRTYTQSAADWYWEMDSDLRFSFFSAPYSQISGVPIKDIIGKTRMELPVSGISDAQWEDHLTTLKAHKPFRNFEHTRIREGKTVWLSVNGEPVFDKNGTFTGYRGTGSDITARKKSEKALAKALEQAQKANQAKSEFLSSMSHELRTPLNSILGFSYLVLNSTKETLSDKQRSLLDEIHKSGTYLLDMVDQVLEYNTLLNDDIKPLLGPVDINGVIADTLLNIEKRAQTKEIHITQDITPNLAPFISDGARLNQILLCLLTNAVKYNRDKGTINISAHTHNENTLRIAIKDTGIGIPSEMGERIFHPFDRLNHQNGTILGTGIGLTIAKRLAELLNAELDYQSKEGVGSTFWLDLPYSPLKD